MASSSPTQSTEVPDEAIDKAGEALCENLPAGLELRGGTWIEDPLADEWGDWAAVVLQAAAPAIRNQEHQRLREALERLADRFEERAQAQRGGLAPGRTLSGVFRDCADELRAELAALDTLDPSGEDWFCRDCNHTVRGRVCDGCGEAREWKGDPSGGQGEEARNEPERVEAGRLMSDEALEKLRCHIAPFYEPDAAHYKRAMQAAIREARRQEVEEEAARLERLSVGEGTEADHRTPATDPSKEER